MAMNLEQLFERLTPEEIKILKELKNIYLKMKKKF